MNGHLMLAITLVCSSLALAACAGSGSGSGENAYQKHQSDFLKSVSRNGRPPVGGARANGD